MTTSLIGFGSLGTTRPSSWRELLQEEPSSHPTGRLWQSASNFRSIGLLPSSARWIVVSEGGGGAAPTAAASLGIASSKVGVSGWDLKSFNEIDPVEVSLTMGLRESEASYVASSPRRPTEGRGPTS